MKALLIQENGRHDVNRNFRECFSLQRAFAHHGVESDVWGLGHINYGEEPDYESYDLIINLENYDEIGWVPPLRQIQVKKYLWCIDAHVKGIDSYLQIANEGNYDLILQAVPEFVTQNSIYFPSCYDDDLVKPLDNKKIYDVGFCGSISNRQSSLDVIEQNFDNHKFDILVLGKHMVEAINSYKIHFNENISVDINYRNFETIGCGTCLLTSSSRHYNELGFRDQENYLSYSSTEEMIEKIKMVLDNDNLLHQISKNGLLLSEKHTYKNRVNLIMSK